jgi:hypothetical protein
MKNSIKSIILALLAVASMQGCVKETEYPEPTPAREPSALRSRFLFANAGVASPTLNTFLNNVGAASNLAAYTNSAYISTQAGLNQLRAKAATGTIGGTLGSNDLVFRAGATNNNNFNAVSGRNYTAFVTDTLARPRPSTAGGTDPGGLRFLVVEDNLAAPAAGKAHVRFFHLAPGAPAVWINAEGSTTAIFNDRRYRATSSGSGSTLVNFNAFTPVDAGTYTFEVRTGSATGNVALTVPGVVLEDGKIYTIYAKGTLAGTGANALGAGVIVHN